MNNSAAIRRDKEFVWGEIAGWHYIGDVEVVEYHPWKRDGVSVLRGKPDFATQSFHTFVGGRDTNHSWPSLWEAVIHGIAVSVDPEPNAARWNTYAAARVLRIER